jgi:hypothetical protein
VGSKTSGRPGLEIRVIRATGTMEVWNSGIVEWQNSEIRIME